MNEIGTKTVSPLTDQDIRIIKDRFSKKRKIVYYFMSAFFTIGTLVSAIALYTEVQSVNRLNNLAAANGEEMFFSVNYLEGLIPFFVGTGLALILILVLVVFKQELDIELKNNRKWIYKGLVTNRSEKATRVGIGKNRETYYDYYIHLGDISFEHKDLFFEINAGDSIDVQISERLNIVLYKNIIRNKAAGSSNSGVRYYI